MPRASRYLLEGYTYHLAHRCHDRHFLLKFSEEREEYREWLRTAINRHGVSVYAYCITSNHAHVVAHGMTEKRLAR
jgi:putative transposase